MLQLDRYTHSGRISSATIPATLFVGLGSGFSLAYLYQLLVTSSTSVQVNVVLTIVFGCLLGYIVGFVLRWSPCRNATIAAVLAICCGAAADLSSFYFQYRRAIVQRADEERARLGRPYPPVTFREYLTRRAAGTWAAKRGGGSDYSGVSLYVIWGLEALFIMGCTTLIAGLQLRDPFCEDCQRWTEVEELGRKNHIPPDQLAAATTIGDLIRVAPAIGGAREDVVYRLHSCTECLQQAYLTVTREWVELDAKGQSVQRSETLASQVPVTQKHRDTLRQSLRTCEQSPLELS